MSNNIGNKRNNNAPINGGIGFCGLLTIAFIVLKLIGQIEWPWIWVFAPMWMPIAIVVVYIITICIFIRW